MENKNRFFKRVFGNETLSRAEKMRIYKENNAAIQTVDKVIEDEKVRAVQRGVEGLNPRVREVLATWKAAQELGVARDFLHDRFQSPWSSKDFYFSHQGDGSYAMGIDVFDSDGIWMDAAGWSITVFNENGMDTEPLNPEVFSNRLESFMEEFESREEKFYCAVDMVLVEFVERYKDELDAKSLQQILEDTGLSRVEKMKKLTTERDVAIQKKFEELTPRIQEVIATWEVGREIDFPLPEEPEFELSNSDRTKCSLFLTSDIPDTNWCIGFWQDEGAVICTDLKNWYEAVPSFGNDSHCALRECKQLNFDEIPASGREWFVNQFDGFEQELYHAVDAALEEQDATMEKQEQTLEWLSLDAQIQAASGKRNELLVGDEGRARIDEERSR